jgi:hypothetical protein
MTLVPAGWTLKQHLVKFRGSLYSLYSCERSVELCSSSNLLLIGGFQYSLILMVSKVLNEVSANLSSSPFRTLHHLRRIFTPAPYEWWSLGRLYEMVLDAGQVTCALTQGPRGGELGNPNEMPCWSFDLLTGEDLGVFLPRKPCNNASTTSSLFSNMVFAVLRVRFIYWLFSMGISFDQSLQLIGLADFCFLVAWRCAPVPCTVELAAS